MLFVRQVKRNHVFVIFVFKKNFKVALEWAFRDSNKVGSLDIYDYIFFFHGLNIFCEETAHRPE